MAQMVQVETTVLDHKSMAQIQTKWINLDQVMWVEEEGANLKLFFEKSTILTFPKTGCKKLLDILCPPIVPVPSTKKQAKKSG